MKKPQNTEVKVMNMKKKKTEETVKYVLDFRDAYNALVSEYKEKGMDKITASYNAKVDEYKVSVKAYQDLAKQYKIKGNLKLVDECREKAKKYHELIKECRKKQMSEFVDQIGLENSSFCNYRNAMIHVIKIKMMTGKKMALESANFSCNRAMVESLRASGEFHYDKFATDNETINDIDGSGIDDVLTYLTTKILLKELSEQYFLYKDDAAWAFRSISQVIHNELCDMIKKIPGNIPINPKKTACYKTTYLDSTITDEEGNITTVGAMTAAPNQDTENASIRPELIKYAKNTFVHAVIEELIPKPHYLLAYLNALADRSGIELCHDIISEGFSSTLTTIIDLLKDKDIHVDYLNNIELKWKDNIGSLKKNSNIVNNWSDESRKIARKMCVKMSIY